VPWDAHEPAKEWYARIKSRPSFRPILSDHIPGAPPSLIDPPPACRFHPRCPSAMRVCSTKDPIEVSIAAGHVTECWLHGPEDEIPAGGEQPLEREEIAVAEEA
jgi:oligopeptide/dipeptide ABC transporter ATP-binding protein